jgi:hypothetical protein
VKEEKFVDIRKLIKSKNPRLLKWLPGFAVRYLERILHQDETNEILALNKDKYDVDFCHAIMEYFNIEVIIDGIEKIPVNDRIVIVMNHPLGGMDAIAFVSGVAQRRQDFKFIVNDLLLNLTNMRGLFLGVNKFGKNDEINEIKSTPFSNLMIRYVFFPLEKLVAEKKVE